MDGVSFWLESLLVLGFYALLGGGARASWAASAIYAAIHLRHVVRDARTGALRGEWLWDSPAAFADGAGYLAKGFLFHFAPLLLGAPSWTLLPWAILSHKAYLVWKTSAPAPDGARLALLKGVFPRQRFLGVEGQVKGFVPLTDGARDRMLGRAADGLAAKAVDDARAPGGSRTVHVTELYGKDPAREAERAALSAFLAVLLARAGDDGRLDLLVKDPSVDRAAAVRALPPAAAALMASGRLRLWLASEPEGSGLFREGKISERALRDAPLLGNGRPVPLDAIHGEDVLRDADGAGVELLPLLGELLRSLEKIQDALRAMRQVDENA